MAESSIIITILKDEENTRKEFENIYRHFKRKCIFLKDFILKIKEKLTFPCPHLHSGQNQRIAQRFVEPA